MRYSGFWRGLMRGSGIRSALCADGLKQRRLVHGARQRIKCHVDDVAPVARILFRPKGRIAANVLNARAANHSERARREREAKQRRNERYRNSGRLNLFCDRCAATIASASGRD